MSTYNELPGYLLIPTQSSMPTLTLSLSLSLSLSLTYVCLVTACVGAAQPFML